MQTVETSQEEKLELKESKYFYLLLRSPCRVILCHPEVILTWMFNDSHNKSHFLITAAIIVITCLTHWFPSAPTFELGTSKWATSNLWHLQSTAPSIFLQIRNAWVHWWQTRMKMKESNWISSNQHVQRNCQTLLSLHLGGDLFPY